MLVLTSAEGGARLLSLLFLFAAGRALSSTANFGVLSYTILLSLNASFAVQVLCTSLSRELGAARGQRERTGEALGSSLVAAGALLVASSALCLAAAAAGLTSGANLPGLLATLAGIAIFQVYYAITRGIGRSARAAFTYAGASAAQLAAFGVLVVVTHPSVLVALLVYGASSVVPVLVLELVQPTLRGSGLRVSGAALRRLAAPAGSLLVAQLFFFIWLSADQVWVQRALGSTPEGLYNAARTLSQIFIIVPFGVGGALLPRVAELRSAGEDRKGRRLIAVATLVVLGLSAMIAVGFVLARTPLLTFWKPRLAAGAPAMVGLGIAMGVFGAFSVLTQGAIGWGRAGVYTLGIAVAAVTELALLLLGPARMTTGADAKATSMVVALLVVCLWLVLRPLKSTGGETAILAPTGAQAS